MDFDDEADELHEKVRDDSLQNAIPHIGGVTEIDCRSIVGMQWLSWLARVLTDRTERRCCINDLVVQPPHLQHHNTRFFSIVFAILGWVQWSSGTGLVTEVAGSTHTRSTASNLEQVANLLCANSASYPQQDGKWVVAMATGGVKA